MVTDIAILTIVVVVTSPASILLHTVLYATDCGIIATAAIIGRQGFILGRPSLGEPCVTLNSLHIPWCCRLHGLWRPPRHILPRFATTYLLLCGLRGRSAEEPAPAPTWHLGRGRIGCIPRKRLFHLLRSGGVAPLLRLLTALRAHQLVKDQQALLRALGRP